MLVNASDGSFEPYLVRPTKTVGPVPAIIVVQEIFGVNADIRTTCEEVASHGFIAVAPELFRRDAPGLDLNCWSKQDWEQGLTLYERYNFDLGVSDLAATAEALRSLDGCSGKVGITGFCLGGLMSFLTAVRAPIDAAVAYYGSKTDLYVEEVKNTETPILLHLAGEDEFMPREAQMRIENALAGRADTEVYTYSGQSHAFARHGGTHFHAPSTMLANARTYDFFARHLLG